MPVLSASSCRPWLIALAGSSLLLACTVDQVRKKRIPPDCAVEECYAELPDNGGETLEPDKVNKVSGAFGAAERPSGGLDGGGPGPGPIPTTYCTGSVAPGDLAIVEVMVTSRAGSNDPGEWVEIQNTRDCILKLKGISVSSPRGEAEANVAQVPDDLELAPGATFVVAGSVKPEENNQIPGTVIAWNAMDVLRNAGDTLTVSLGTTEIASLTYPGFTNLTPGRTLTFPSDCKPEHLKDFERWSLAFNEWQPTFKGTPNRPNSDVTCF